ncbi:E3 ubiquitin-protein ligase znrf3 [Characodon lateralis]|uniref:E3 ubiquitin-protein ligase znrf3 n=1 Tax=Characodon lateralis TaxID=208331 RepID=A0ABU7F5Z4_9TELE|nr:E3 ubiquitin-protein ligase znrf3 [Characodon lateralis]
MMIFLRRGSDRLPDSVVLVIWLLAASLGAALAKDTAFVEVVLFESSPNGDYTTYTTGLQGRFSKAGATISAEGEIVQGVGVGEHDDVDLAPVPKPQASRASPHIATVQLYKSF